MPHPNTETAWNSDVLIARQTSSPAAPLLAFVFLIVVGLAPAGCGQSSTPAPSDLDLVATPEKPGEVATTVTDAHNDHTPDQHTLDELTDSVEIDGWNVDSFKSDGVEQDVVFDEADTDVSCGNGVCSMSAGENCKTCPSDCLCPYKHECLEDGSCCQPVMCGSLGFECGAFENPCGGIVDCGNCLKGECIEGVCAGGSCDPAVVSRFSGYVRDIQVSNGLARLLTGDDIHLWSFGGEGEFTWDATVGLPPWTSGVVYRDGIAYSLQLANDGPECSGAACFSINVSDTSSPETASIIGNTAWAETPTAQYKFHDLALGGPRLYALVWGSSIYGLDVSDSATPVLLPDLAVPPANVGVISSIAANETALFATEMLGGVRIYDIANATSLEQVGFWNPSPSVWLLAINKTAGIVVDSMGTGHVVDLAHPISPVILSSEITGWYGCDDMGAVMGSEYLIVHGRCQATDMDYRISVYQRGPNGTVSKLAEFTQEKVSAVALEFPLLYLAEKEHGVRVYNIETHLISDLTPHGAPIRPVFEMSIANGLGFAGSEDGWQILDLSLVKQPKQIASVKTGRQVRFLEVIADKAYLFSAEFELGKLKDHRLELWDITDAVHPIKKEENSIEGTVMAVCRQQDVLYWIARDYDKIESGVRRVVASTDGVPEVAELFETDRAGADLVVDGSFIYVSWESMLGWGSNEHGFHIIDVSDRTQPVEVAQYVNNPGLSAAHIAKLGTTILIAGAGQEEGGEELHSIDVSNPESPSLIWTAPVGLPLVTVQGSRAYLSGDGGEFAVIDASDPQQPKVLWDAGLYGAYAHGSMSLDSGYAFQVNPWVTLVDIHGCWLEATE
jgi:hypothetical protein